MKILTYLKIATISALNAVSAPGLGQMCPGGGLNFESAVTFDPAWVYGCNTGTSCNGGVNFDNRAPCQPTTTMDVCAPAPSCGNIANNGSNIWFRFYASAPTVTLSSFQNTSFVIGLQAFSGGTTCGSLTQIGCAVSGGPSSGVNLTLNGLNVGQLYYYRIFGSSSAVSQRTGIYCFCGTSGLQNYILPVGLSSFKGIRKQRQVQFIWNVDKQSSAESFVLQASNDTYVFYDLYRTARNPDLLEYVLNHPDRHRPFAYYRLKLESPDGVISYSPVLKIKAEADTDAINWDFNSNRLTVASREKTSLKVLNTFGEVVYIISVSEGNNYYHLPIHLTGLYFVQNSRTGSVSKIIIRTPY